MANPKARGREVSSVSFLGEGTARWYVKDVDKGRVKK